MSTLQYNSSATGADVISVVNDYLNTNNTVFPLASKTRLANQVLSKIWSIIFDSYGGWEFDDANNSNYPISTTTITTGQSNYSLPSESITIRDVEVLPFGSTTWQKLIPITQELVNQAGWSEASMFTSNGTPIYYKPIGPSITIYPASNYTQASSLRVTYDRDMSTFVSTDTTKRPGFISTFHELLPIGIALEYARRNQTSNFTFLNDLWNQTEDKLRKYYSQRYHERFPARVTVQDATRQYL